MNGFSFIELIVVLGIVGFLSALASPAYLSCGVPVRRVEGQSALCDAAIRLEQYAIKSTQGYAGATLEVLGVAEKTERGWYRLSLQDVDTMHYTLVATPTFKDTLCQRLSYNEKGERLYEGSGSSLICWGG